MARWFTLLLIGLSLAGCGSSGNRASLQASSIECAPYARQVSGIDLHGDAASWWDAAAGRYTRSFQPTPGAALVFRRSARLPYGHVSVVTSLEGARAIRVTQANWVHHRIAHGEPVVDVSPGNDWTAVRVWWAPARALGTTIYRTFGFVGPAQSGSGLVASNDEQGDPAAP